jgi:choline dehydrogenase-like flavoprotein
MSLTENLARLPQLRGSNYEFGRFNALRHGVLSRHTVLPWEDGEEYRALLEALVAEHKPVGPTEEHLVEELAGVIWRKRRLRPASAKTPRRERSCSRPAARTPTAGSISRSVSARPLPIPVNWCYETEPDPGAADRRVFWPRGKVLGGSSSINGMVYIRGQAEDFDHWRQLGNTGWSFDDVLPYFRRSEHQMRGAASPFKNWTLTAEKQAIPSIFYRTRPG